MTVNPSAEGRLLKFIPYMSVAAFFIGWQLIVSLGVVPKMRLAAPLDVLWLFIDKLTQDHPDGALLYVHVLVSLEEAILGYFLALAIGIPLGLLMGWFHTVEGFARPIFEMIRPIPAVAWIPSRCIPRDPGGADDPDLRVRRHARGGTRGPGHDEAVVPAGEQIPDYDPFSLPLREDRDGMIQSGMERGVREG